MTPERFREAGHLYHAALEIEPEARAAFLDRACGEDEELRREAESLLRMTEVIAQELGPERPVVALSLAAPVAAAPVVRIDNFGRVDSTLYRGSDGAIATVVLSCCAP